MNAITPVESLPSLAWQNHPVITTEFLASVYGAEEHQIRQNFNNNASRFEEGVHFFKLTGSELKAFILQVDNIYSQISNKTRSLMLWTERGAIRHAKILDTQQAWDVQGKLEDCYFNGNPKHVLDEKPTSPRPVLDSEFQALQQKYIALLETENQRLRTSGSANQSVNASPKPSHKPWTKKDVGLMLRYTREGMSKKAIADTLGRAPKSVCAKFQSLVKAGKIKVSTQVKTVKGGV
jgi:hypothetical protein